MTDDLERLNKDTTFTECKRAMKLWDRMALARFGCYSRHMSVWIWDIATAATCGVMLPMDMGANDKEGLDRRQRRNA